MTVCAHMPGCRSVLQYIQGKYGSRYTRFYYPRLHIFAVIFQCHKEHQYPIRVEILKAFYLLRTFSRLISVRDAYNDLRIREICGQFNIEMIKLCVYNFTRFRRTRWSAGTQIPCIIRVTCTWLIRILILIICRILVKTPCSSFLRRS
jgi:hypothetical protein